MGTLVFSISPVSWSSAPPSHGALFPSVLPVADGIFAKAWEPFLIGVDPPSFDPSSSWNPVLYYVQL